MLAHTQDLHRHVRSITVLKPDCGRRVNTEVVVSEDRRGGLILIISSEWKLLCVLHLTVNFFKHHCCLLDTADSNNTLNEQ